MSDEPDQPIVKGKKPSRGMGWKHPDIVRRRIQTSYLINRLGQCVAGKVELTSTQLKAAEILLRKALPDLSSVEHTGTIQHRNVTDLSDSELLAIAAGRSAGTAETEERATLN